MEHKIKRLSIDMPENLHHNIKVWAAQRRMTVREFVLFAVASQLAVDKTNEDRDEK